MEEISRETQVPIRVQTKALQVSRSGYYAHQKREESEQAKHRSFLLEKIKVLFFRYKKRYGSPRIWECLVKEGIACSENTVAKLMQMLGLKAKAAKAFRPNTTLSKHNYPRRERIFDNETVKATKPNEVWAGDITYIPTRNGFVYLAVVLDVFTRKIVGWHVDTHMRTELVDLALTQALKRETCRPEDQIFHSDQGVQYASTDFQQTLETLKIVQSMSRKGNCYDNAYVESFFKTLKTESLDAVFDTKKQVQQELFEYIEGFYNTIRMHSSLDYQSPIEYQHSYQLIN